MLRIRYDVYDRIQFAIRATGLQLESPSSFRSSHAPLAFESKPLPFDKRIIEPSSLQPTKKNENLVHRPKGTRSVQFIGQPIGECSPKTREAFNKLSLKISDGPANKWPKSQITCVSVARAAWTIGIMLGENRNGPVSLPPMPAHPFTRYL